MKIETLALLRKVDDAIAKTKDAFGAPGGYGYNTPEGAALYELYLVRQDCLIAIAEAKRAQSAPKSIHTPLGPG